ncbi:hypothetical protein F5Y04DRAFT_247761 [Hypomontagnella monticulosa]|nr:hypothetical protein F5Y04DRAFT_247761 [Hypomontagnella monticulosa]
MISNSAEAAANLGDFFMEGGFYWPNRDTDHGCKAHNDDLKASYKEAAKLIDSAVQAISYLKSTPRPFIFRLKDKWNWDRQAHSMLSYFGIEISKDGGPLPASKNNFDYVEMIFNQMQYGMQTDSLQIFRPPPSLYCGADSWKYYGPEDQDPQDPTRKINEIMSGSGIPKWPNGFWYFKSNRIMSPQQTPDYNAFCGERVAAFTLAGLSVITFCDWAFTSTVKLLDLSAAKVSDPLLSPERQSLSYLWVHELAHFYGNYPNAGSLPDQPAVDTNGNPLTDSSGKQRVTYGVSQVLNLAKNNANAASRTAEAYALFSLAMYHSQFDWALGSAQPFGILY